MSGSLWSRSRGAAALQGRLAQPSAGVADRAGYRLDCCCNRPPEWVEAFFRRMSVFKNGKLYHFEFRLDGRRHRGSTGTANKQQAIAEERRQRERLEKSYSQVIEEEAREQRRKTIQFSADEFLIDYRAKHQSPKYAEYALGHVSRRLGSRLVVEITPN